MDLTSEAAGVRYGVTGRPLGVRLLASAALLVGGAGVVLGLAPGRPADGGVIEVTGGRSVQGYLLLTDEMAKLPDPVRQALGPAADLGVVLLGLLLVTALWMGWRRGPETLAGVLLAAAGTVGAYLGSELIKTVITEDRPCRAVAAVQKIAECPSASDWSFPSNHSTLAAGFAIGLLVALPRIGAAAVPVALGVGLLRVLAGVHYPHDVIAGFAMGGAVAGATVLVFSSAVALLVRSMSRIPGLGFLAVDAGPRPVSARS